MPILEIITIGTELLLGEITDTNSTYIARTLRDHGIDIYRITTIGDNPGRIASTIREALGRADIIITTGGLGPTIDDPTRQAVADATDRSLVFQPELWDKIVERFKNYGREPTENNRRQAYIPADSIPIDNPVGTAPCYIVEVDNACITSLPGVPQEMSYILQESIIPYLSKKFNLKTQIIKATVLHAASIGESVIDEKIDDLETMSNPTVGLLAHPGQVDIRVTAKASSEFEALALSQPVVAELRTRLGENIYGQDAETLESVVCQIINTNNLSLSLGEYQLEGNLISRIKLGQPNQLLTHILEEKPVDLAHFEKQISSIFQADQTDICFAVALVINDNVTAQMIYQDCQRAITKERRYGGPRGYANLWAQNIGLDFLRRQLIKHVINKKTHKETGET